MSEFYRVIDVNKELRDKYTANDGTQLVKHNHGAYIRGWCEWLDSWERGFANFDNPFSKYYLTDLHDSWEAGRSDAANYLAGV